MHQRWSDYRVFWREFRQAYRTTGAVLPSGPALAAALTRFVREGQQLPLPPGEGRGEGERPADLTPSPVRPRRILEVGPGTGAVTSRILRDMRPGDRLVLVERNERFVDFLRERLNAPGNANSANERVSLVHASVEDLPDDKQFDVIVSGLPLNNFEAELVELILAKLTLLLAPGGTLSFFEYVGMRSIKRLVSKRSERDRLQAVGRVFRSFLGENEIKRDLVFANVPPAWVHHVRKGAGG